MLQLLTIQFLRTKTCQLGLILILLLGLVSILTGKQFLDEQEQMTELAIKTHEEHIARNIQYHGDDLGLLLYYLKFALINQSEPLAALSIGQGDLNPNILRFKILTFEGQKYDTDLVNPTKLLYGNLDMSFILVYIFPLLIIAFTYNLISEEEESGTWKMVQISANSKIKYIFAKLGVRLILVLVTMSLLLVVASWVLNIPWGNNLWAFWLMGILYQLFWGALSFCVILLRQTSSVNAVSLLSLWLLLLVLLPGIINNTITNTYPVPEAYSTILQQRDGYHQKWDTGKRATMEAFYERYPQFKDYGYPSEEGFSWLWYYAMQHLGDEESRGSSLEMQNKLVQRQEMSRQISRFIPSMHTLLAFNDLAETGLTQHLDFLQYASSVHENLRLYFYPQIFSASASNEVDWERAKPEFYEPTTEPIGLLKKLGPLLLIITIFVGLAGLIYRAKFSA